MSPAVARLLIGTMDGTTQGAESETLSMEGVRRFLGATRLPPAFASVALLVSSARALTRPEVARAAGLSLARTEEVLADLRLLFMAPKQGQLPLIILHEAIAYCVAGANRGYVLPHRRSGDAPAWHETIGPLRRALASLTREEREMAELLVDPDVLNESAIAAILRMSGNQAERIRYLLRERFGAKKRAQLRLALLRAALLCALGTDASGGARQLSCADVLGTPKGDGVRAAAGQDGVPWMHIIEDPGPPRRGAPVP